ncbi:transcriptional activator NhaR [Vibrio salinus]|uniref:transcriptional activator NhaR n=1 Tax=Vibrio salinus TaxID=2899784 RepID=UPI001E622522|nr:transcriptional activator NhaR [Vibrio salinus]MCE0493237.1 transcriptional activator NhaR [Vibrio salinus]
MSHLNYNHLYYFWMVCKNNSVTKAADALFLTPQTVTGQLKSLEERLGGKLTKRAGRSIEATELGQLVFKYADRMFGLSYEMLDIVNYSQRSNLLFDVGVADALSKELVSEILSYAIPSDSKIHLRCFESTHEMLLEQLSQHKLDMILSDCPVDSTRSPGLFSKKLGESVMSFFTYGDYDGQESDLIEHLTTKKLLIPGSRTAMGRNVIHWFDQQGIQPDILGEFDDVALMLAFAQSHQNTVFIAPSSFLLNRTAPSMPNLVGEIPSVSEGYYVIFAERMIQHPSVKNLCDADLRNLFHL